jgi:hypothetical protein
MMGLAPRALTKAMRECCELELSLALLGSMPAAVLAVAAVSVSVSAACAAAVAASVSAGCAAALPVCGCWAVSSSCR